VRMCSALQDGSRTWEYKACEYEWRCYAFQADDSTKKAVHWHQETPKVLSELVSKHWKRVRTYARESLL
jgi:hypothetical protein